MFITNQPPPGQPADALDELITQLLACGGVLSQMIAGMVEFEASGKSAPDTAPIPDIAHSLIRSVSGPVGKRHSNRDIRVAAKIVDELTQQICEDICYLPPDFIDSAMPGPMRPARRPSC